MTKSDLNQLSTEELQAQAADLKIINREKLSREALIRAIYAWHRM